MNVSIIIPAYNEENSIGKVIEEIRKAVDNYEGNCELIVVNDGSTDGTSEAVKQSQAMLIEHPVNRGYGAALKTGIKKAMHDIIVMTDADGTYPNEEIPNLVKYIEDHDMVVGARTGENVKIPFIRKPAKWVISKLANYLGETEIPDLNSGLRVMRKEIIERFLPLLPNGFSFTTTITLAMLTNGYSVKYVPIDYHKRTGKSKMKSIRDTLNFIQLITRTVMYFNPLKVFLPVSLSFFAISALLLLYRAFIHRAFGSVTVILFVAGVQILALGMIADLINKRMSIK